MKQALPPDGKTNNLDIPQPRACRTNLLNLSDKGDLNNRFRVDRSTENIQREKLEKLDVYLKR